ncbi:ATP-dependent DNA helicase DinG [Neobacillus vireti]|uniref:3'-5' exonuclease DinG n=1 Tax=Neobacillus vireti LMG 21834 TaxID=1131730 RepID=A0AB94IHW0_9BACI|nr:ATP-dependent DNA helicase DinG [Neobacillus vireti]ETI66626.1 bifunctional ATP-dependent DNA helicase/DNA polymerase III subunit epsilon [Neobacillus vireti LMG 21834]KLT17192.1 ATP-dependent DNA helicase DinG [Neobacillus vireti]
MSNKFVVVDLETTGNLPKKGDKIIQFGAVVIENGIITDRFSSLVNPQKSIPVFIEELTGINDEMVKNAPLFAEITEKVMSLLDGAFFVAHNVLFDLSFLQEELIQAGLEGFYGSVLDTVEMARFLFPTADGYKLTDLAEKENLQHDRPHQADSDAQVTAELFLILLERLSSLPLVTLKQLTHLSGGLKSDLQQMLGEIMANKDMNTEELPDAIEIYRNLALKKLTPLVVNKEADMIDFQYPSTEEEKIEVVNQGFEFFEKRTGQFMMMDTVYQAFQNKNHSLIEAGTGVGKSLGYLLPAACFSKQIKVPIVVSTHTIQLQEQLLKKEIPLLEKILPFKINSVLLKGRSHYLSLEKFSQTLLDKNDNYDTTLTKMQILVWLTETETGDKDELNLSSGGFIYWNKIKNEAPIFSKKDMWLEKDFYQKAKRDAQAADIIITNHSLLLSDIKGEGSILPAFDYVILDEGHHLEKVASQFFGHSLDYLSARLMIGQFGLYEQKQLFYEMEELLAAIPRQKGKLLHTFELNQMVIDLTYEMDEFFKLIAVYAKAKQINKKGFNRIKVRFSHRDSGKERNALVHSAERVAFILKDLHAAIMDRLESIKKAKGSLTAAKENKLEELYLFGTELEELRNTVIKCFLKESKDVKWIEMDTRSPQNITTFLAQPAFVAEQLKERFFQIKKAVVITSATLTVNHSYSYIMKELGLNADATVQQSIPSPFEYKNQVQLFIPEDLPAINSVSLDEYVIAITEHIITIAEATKGRMLLLFTAYDMLKKTYELIKESGFLNEYVLIAQGITSGSRTRLTRNFQRYDKAILLGTSSFWEGVDIPGEDLSCLVIVRLPFSSPEEPLTEAKCQIISEQGGNAFSEYSLPEAILRFKQGFGRLIRTEKDRGLMIVFDRRIVTTKYGKAFLKSIPSVPVKNGTINELVELIHSWL